MQMQIYYKKQLNLKAGRHKTLFIFAFLLVSLAVRLQAAPQTVLIDDNKITVGKAFEKITRQTGYNIFFGSGAIDINRRIELPAKPTPLGEMLDAILKDTGCGYRIAGKGISIFRSAEQPSQSQPPKSDAPIIYQSVEGTVLDDWSGRPLADARVSVSSVVGKEAFTDHTGSFSLGQIPSGSQKIRTTREGYFLSERGIEIPATGPANVEIRLKSITPDSSSVRSDADKGGIHTIEGIEHNLVLEQDTVYIAREREATTTAYERNEEYIEPVRLDSVRRWSTLGIKTNLLYLATLSPNAGIEWGFKPKWSVELTGGFNLLKSSDIPHWLIKPELRYWLCRTFDGHFFGLHGIVGQGNIYSAWFNNIPKSESYDGWAYGGGLTYGYQWAIGKRWNLEAAIGVGYLHLHYKEYQFGNDCQNCRGRQCRNYFGPTKAGISLIYMIK